MKNIIRIAIISFIMMMACLTVSAANLTTTSYAKDGIVTVNFYLDEMPSDLTEIAAITIRLKANDNLTSVRCEGANDKLNKNLNIGKNIIWYASSVETSLTEADIEAADGLLFKMIYSVEENASGTIEIDYEMVEITDFGAKKSDNVSYTSIKIDLGMPDEEAQLAENIKTSSKSAKYAFDNDGEAFVIVVENITLPEDKAIFFGDIPAFAMEENSRITYYAADSKEIDITSVRVAQGNITTYVCGDTDGNSVVTASDALLALKRAVKKTDIFENDPAAYIRADVAGKGEYIITARDAYNIALIAAK